MDVQQKLEMVLSVRPGGAAERIAPALIGPTGSGKTSRVLQYAASRGLPVVRLLLGTMLPEDVLGLPRVVGGKGAYKTVWSLPDWAAKAVERPHVIFLDELDKARPEVLSTVLTLLAERRVRDISLHHGTEIVAAMQPVDRSAWLADETGRAISARLCYIPVTYDWGHFDPIDLSGLPVPPVPVSPILDHPSPRQVSWAIQAIRTWMSAGHEQGDITNILHTGLLGEWARLVVARVMAADAPLLTPKDIVMSLVRDPERVENVDIPTLLQISSDVWLHGSPEVLRRVLIRVWTKGTKDDAETFLRLGWQGIHSAAHEGEVEILPGSTEDQVAEAIEDAAREIAKVWNDNC